MEQSDSIDSRVSLDVVVHYQRLAQAQRPALSFVGGEFEAWRRRLAPAVRERLGLDRPGPARLAPRVLWRRERPEGLVEKVRFTVEPGLDAVAYVGLPAGVRAPYPCVICLQGHSTGMHVSLAVDRSTEREPIDVSGDRDIALQAMRRGFAVLCLEQRGFGERGDHGHERFNSCHRPALSALLQGRTLLGDRIFDVDRAIDYLCTRAEIDPARIGAVGNSAGGTASLYAAALLPRVSFAIPSSCFSRFAASWGARHFCVCGYVPRMLEVADLADIAGLAAPKPMVLALGRMDRGLPLEDTCRAFAQVERIYAVAGAGDRVRLVIGDEGHRFYGEASWHALSELLDAATP
jgi:pimeloyl-ACP methyl ester carboxylesterase